jgi:hypothetical protein
LTPYHTGDFTLTELTYADGPLGNRYIDINNTSPSLVDAGSRNASAAGLSSYTILPNQFTDSGMVDIGYHYPVTGNDSTGTDFWIAFFNMNDDSDGDNLSLYISSPVGVTGTVTIPGFGITNAFTVAPGGLTNIDIDPSLMMFYYDLVETYGIHITANQPVSVYALDYAWADSASFTCYPTTLLGTNYCVLARPSLAGGSSELGIVATADDTTVTIMPSQTADLDTSSGTNAYTKTLQQGQTYQIQSSDDTDDVTGTLITSDKPVGVFAGADFAHVPDANTAANNPLMQEQLPVNLWGTNVVSLSFAGRENGDSYRVLAANNNTVITITGKVVTIVLPEPGPGDYTPYTVTTTNETVVVTNQAGGFYDIIVDGPVVFQGSKPIQVAQFANGVKFDNINTLTLEGDPCEILLPPAGHYLQTNIVFTPHLLNSGGFPIDDFDEYYLNLIVAQSAITNTLVDGLPISATNFMAIGNSGYYGAQLTVTNVTHTVTSFQPVGVEVYGWGNCDAYSYFGGIVK